jgi:outer membrane protein assembly factor BamA
LEINFQTEVNSKQLETDNIFTAGSENYLGTEALDIFRSDITLDLDFRDRDNLATKGMRFYLNHEIGWVLNQDEKLYHKLQSSIEQFISTRNRGPVTLGIRLGGSFTSGDIPYYHRYFLGQNGNLRGYRMNRFTGDASLFLNTDLRWKLGEFKTSIVPLGYGLRGFYDRGRVFLDGEDSTRWHQGYGFGFYVVPLMESLSFNLSLAFSEEESALVLFSIGKTFN